MVRFEHRLILVGLSTVEHGIEVDIMDQRIERYPWMNRCHGSKVNIRTTSDLSYKRLLSCVVQHGSYNDKAMVSARWMCVVQHD
jgi:hypothetical protein